MALSARLFGTATLLLLGFFWTWTVTVADFGYETPNNMCGGYFRYIRGKINFTFPQDDPDDRNKLCVWTIAPTQMYNRFEITRFDWPPLVPCNEFAIVINGFTERARDVSLSNRYCGSNRPTFPLYVNASVLVISLMVRSVHYILPVQGNGFVLEWKERSFDDQLPAVRMIETYYSWGKPDLVPIPYFAAGFYSNGMKTFVWPKANYSDGANYEFHMSFDEVTFTHRDNCTDGVYDFVMLCYFDNEGRIKLYNDGFFENRNVSDTAPFVSNYGMFIMHWGGGCAIGGGGRMQLFYEHIRIA